jgi:hypothetical protein
MITKFLTSQFAGPILLALFGGLLITLGITAHNLGNAREKIDEQTLTISGQKLAIDLAKTQLAQRDTLIAKQNAAVDAISKVRAEDRTIYVKQYAAADERAKGDDDRGDQLLSLQSEFTDELAQCRASKLLLEQEVGQ